MCDHEHLQKSNQAYITQNSKRSSQLPTFDDKNYFHKKYQISAKWALEKKIENPSNLNP